MCPHALQAPCAATCGRKIQYTQEPLARPRLPPFLLRRPPFTEVAHNPISNLQIQFAKTPEATFREELFAALRRKRKFALRLGHVTREDGWRLKDAAVTKKILRTRDWLQVLDQAVIHAQFGTIPTPLSPEEATRLTKLIEQWRNLSPDDVRLGMRQKGVDMRIGLDISTLTLKKQVDTILLITGDSDFVPAAKLARREGVEFLIDPLWQSVTDDLHEHVDGVMSVYRNPQAAVAPTTDTSPPTEPFEPTPDSDADPA